MTSAPATRKTAPLSRPILATGIVTTVLIAVGAFILSFASLTDLAVRSGITPSLAWIWPVIIDGLIVAATVAIVALAGHGRRTLAYPWALLGFGAVISTAANSIHAILAVDHVAGGVPAAVSAVVAAMPPLVLLAITHLTVILVQKSAPAQPPKKKPVKAAPATSKRSPEAAAPLFTSTFTGPPDLAGITPVRVQAPEAVPV